MVVSTKQIKLFLAILSAIAITNHGAVVNALNLPIQNNGITELKAEKVIAKKSGGRSSGGSFKRKPSRSKSSSPSRSSTKSRSKSYSSPSRSYERRNSTQRSYDDYRRRDSSPNYHRTSRSNSADNFILFVLGFIFFIVIILVLWAIVYKVSRSSSDRTKASNRAKRNIARERDNDRVTISWLQVVLSSEAKELQQDLSNLTTSADTDSVAGLLELMKESVLILRRNENHWTHVASSSKSMDISNAESEFDVLSFNERSKFSGESLSNVEGKITTRESRQTDSDGFPAYIVVTLIIGSADDRALFSQINNVEELQQALQTLSGMREDYLMKFELLWTPQAANEYLTDEELLMEYTKVIPL